MKLLFVADLRSPIARGWIGGAVEIGHEVHIVSSYPGADPLPGATAQAIPLVFAHAGGTDGPTTRHGLRARLPTETAYRIRNLIGPVVVHRTTPAIRRVVESVRPDVVHALRIPFEGIAAALAVPERTPLVVSIWGNDLTLHAPDNPLIGRATRRTLRRTDFLLADCRRDFALANTWGFERAGKTELVPGGGGIRSEVFFPGPPSPALRASLAIPAGVPVVLNARGIRRYVRSRAFLESLPAVFDAHPGAVVVAIGLRDDPESEATLRRLGIDEARVRLVGTVPHAEMGDFYRLATVAVSPTVHDGTPNTLLETMASGVVPVAGDVESVREWIVHGENGLLVDANDPHAIAGGIVTALDDESFRQRANRRNVALITERARREVVLAAMDRLYAAAVGAAAVRTRSQVQTIARR